MNDRIDVLIPHYNDPDGLRRSLSSISSQTWSGEFRVVVVDDGSHPEHRARIQAILAESNLSFILKENGTNQGRPYTRNRLLGLIESPHVTWLDAGDSWLPKKTEMQMSALQDHQASSGAEAPLLWVTCDYHWNEASGRNSVETQSVTGDQLSALMVGRELRAYLWTLLSAREAMQSVGAFDSELPRLQDLDFFLRFVERGGRVIKPRSVQPEPLCIYEKSDIGRDGGQIFRCNEYLIDKHRLQYRKYGAQFYRARRTQSRMLAFRFARNNRSYWLALRFLSGALLRDPIGATRFLARKVLRMK